MEKFISLYHSFGLSTCGKPGCAPGDLCRICRCPRAGAHSPIFFASSDFLNAHGIEHFDFVQYPGDNVYLNPGVGHVIVNLDFCVAEARTLLPIIIGGSRDESHCCPCASVGRQRIGLSNPGIFMEVVTKFRCPYPECCNGLLMSAKEFHAHMEKAHDAYKCKDCGKNYATKENLTRHKSDVHNKRTVTCYPCQDSTLKMVSKSTHQLGKKHLSNCKTYFSSCLPLLSSLPVYSKTDRKILSKVLGK